MVYWLGDNLYLNLTNRCSNSCFFCLRKFRNGVGGFNLTLDRDPLTDEIVSQLQAVINKRDWSEIVFCGFGEPLHRLDSIIEITRWIRKHYGKQAKIRIDTNGQGYLLNKGRDVVTELKRAGIDKVSVSLNASDKETYEQVCRPEFKNAFESVKEFVERAKKRLEVEITAVAIPETDLSKVGDLAERMGVNFRVREYIPCFY